MYCTVHNVSFTDEQGCRKCRDTWRYTAWEQKEKEWLVKLDLIQEKAQELANHAAGLEIDKNGLKRSLDTMTIELSRERRNHEACAATVTRHETKLRAIGLGYRNALEREETLKEQLDAVTAQREEWIERCRIHEKTRCDDCGMDPCGCAMKGG